MSIPTTSFDTLFDGDFASTTDDSTSHDRADWLIDKDGTLVYAPAVAIQPGPIVGDF